MCIESQLVCQGGWEGTTWYHSFDRRENLYPEGFNGLYGPLDKGQFPFRDCSSAKLFGPETLGRRVDASQIFLAVLFNTMTFWLIRFWCSRTQSNKYTDKTISKQQSYHHYSYANSTNGKPLMSSLKHLLAIYHNEKILSYNKLIYLFTLSSPVPLYHLPPSSSPPSSPLTHWYTARVSKVLCKGPNNKQFRFFLSLPL